MGVLAFATSTAAQESANSTTAAGSITGHVTCSDTLRPARFAEVRAVPVPEAGQLAAQLAAEQAGHDLRKSGQTLSVVSSTSVDGSFVLKGLPPGDYLILATLPGYLLPAAAYAHPTKTEDLQALISQIPSVHVTSGETTDVTLSMKRGGVIAGHVRFDDGAPAVRVQVAVESKTITNDRESEAWLGGVNVLPSQRDTTTDDEGAFRIAGLPPGQYIVKAELHFGETARDGHREWLRLG